MRRISFIVLAVAMAAVCVRLGFWQLARLEEKRTYNRAAAGRLAQPLVEPATLPPDSAARFRRVRLDGTFDHERELVLVNRTRNGSPGVWLVTPLRSAANDTALLVVRGWVYAPDGRTVPERERWRAAAGLASDSGWVETEPVGAPATATDSVRAPGGIRRLDPAMLRSRFPYPIRPWYAVLVGGDTLFKRDSTPARLAYPSLGEGQHQSYAIQWFSFAAIALVGTVAFVRRR